MERLCDPQLLKIFFASLTTRDLCIAASRYLTVNGLKMAISIA
jgi:hypothetical protein